MEGWKVHVMKAERLESSRGFVSPSHNFRPSRAPQAKGEACVTVLERRSHLALPAEGRPGPSDDDDDGKITK